MLIKRILWGLLALVSLGVLTVFAAYWSSSDPCDQAGASSGDTIAAVTYCEYGSPEVLNVSKIDKPVPAADQILVRVEAAGLNPLDWHYLRGTPYILRVFAGLRYPTDTRLGVDYAGTVEAVGSDVSKFKPGDAVFGGRNGAIGEYLTASQDGAVAVKPDNLSFAQASSVAIAAVTALQALRDKGELKPGQDVLINGASGGVGTFAVQIAKAFGARVTGVNSTRNVEMVLALGADRVIDYTREDFTQGEARYDLILDCVGNHDLLDLRRVLKPKGKVVMIGEPKGNNWWGPLVGPLKSLAISPFVDEAFIPLLAQLNAEDLSTLAGLMGSGELTPVIDRTYPLAETAEAIRYLETGRARGKVVITM